MLFTDYISVSSWLLSSQDENIFYDFSGLFESNQCKLQPQIYRKVWKGRASAALWFSVCQWRSIHNTTKGILIFNWHHLILLSVKVIYPKYSKHWHHTVAHTIDCVCSKMLNHGSNHGLFLSLFKLIPCPIHWIVYVLAYIVLIFSPKPL